MLQPKRLGFENRDASLGHPWDLVSFATSGFPVLWTKSRYFQNGNFKSHTRKYMTKDFVVVFTREKSSRPTVVLGTVTAIRSASVLSASVKNWFKLASLVHEDFGIKLVAKPNVVIRPAAKLWYLGGKNTFCFHYMFETNFSGHNKIWGCKTKFRGNCSRIPPPESFETFYQIW